MKILCVIDSLGSGGAQRQMVNLACGLKAKGHDVELFIYHPELDFYRSIVNEAGIAVNEVHGVSGFSFKVVRAIAGLLRKRKFEALISFLPKPNFYSILGALFSGVNVFVVVSERASKSSDYGLFSPLLFRLLYCFASRVVVNSHHHAHFLENYFWLKNKLSTIYNGYFMPDIASDLSYNGKKKINLLVIGRIDYDKNGIRLLKGLELFNCRNGYVPNISWAGRQEKNRKSLDTRADMDKLIISNSALQYSWQWLGERSDIPQLLANTDALIHVSLYEGLPNVVCEAFIAAKPVIVSAVCDHTLLVEEGVRGHLCDPLSPESICEAIERFVALIPEERLAMGRNARRYAEEHLTLERMVNEYEALLR